MLHLLSPLTKYMSEKTNCRDIKDDGKEETMKSLIVEAKRANFMFREFVLFLMVMEN